MKLFDHKNREASEASRTLYARFELAHTFVDFMAAVCFIVGSILFFFESEQIPATWLFLIGSFLFAAKPTLRLVREIKLYRMGDVKDLAKRAK
ncbi:YrhK family protein [Roseobacter sp. GAI101]|uniref:YrhK family protein n=1 Tax=Roseobacter sp. (strain GAI101) TaxID=391589 RepID=UPI0001871D9A|nr:YrhK family protein [Roseobacter sp. GAI101]EEB83009.1 hypothetical protein RGAI101_154 [Roseobacter sp. GAI101]